MASPIRILLLAAALSIAAAHAPLHYKSPIHLHSQNPKPLSSTYTYIALDNEDALCLDGSHYGYFICRQVPSPKKTKA
jgi:hypothetical protein